MRIDCATCPGRNRACDGCVMQILFSPSTRDFGPDEQLAGPDVDLLDAVDMFVATALISPAAGSLAKSAIDAGERNIQGDGRRYLRAV